jgi:molybdate transport system substrate-binding protein
MRRAAALAAAALVLLPGCSGGGRLQVYAASSLTDVFRKLDPKARFNFAGSDALAFQLEQGAKADVYASASPRYPDRLHRSGLIDKPRVFATNSLVLIVPRGNPGRVTGLGSLTRRSVTVIVGAKGVPVGDYTRKILDRFCDTTFQPGTTCPRARIVSEEQDVKGVVAKIALGEADAGFVYATDVKPVAGKVRAMRIPGYLQPTVEYELAVVRGAKHRKEAERFVTLVTGPRGREALRRAGFGLP